jgi:hypothetical protein
VTLRTSMRGTCVSRIVNGRCIGHAKLYPAGWCVKSLISSLWEGQTKVIRKPHMTNSKVVATIDLLTNIQIGE